MSKKKTSKGPSDWYPRYTGDYAADTQHLSMTEHGAYNLLLDHIYSTGKKIPSNEKQVFRICKAFEPFEQDAVLSVLSEFFDKSEDGYTQDRVQAELAKRNDISEKRRKARLSRGNNCSTSVGAIDDTATSTATDESSKDDSPDTDDLIGDDVTQAFADFNIFAMENGLSAVQVVSEKRKRAMRARLKECGGIEGFQVILKDIIGPSDFLMGRKTDFKVTIDFILTAGNFVKIMEGNYVNHRPKARAGGGSYFDEIFTAYQHNERNFHGE